MIDHLQLQGQPKEAPCPATSSRYCPFPSPSPPVPPKSDPPRSSPASNPPPPIASPPFASPTAFTSTPLTAEMPRSVTICWLAAHPTGNSKSLPASTSSPSTIALQRYRAYPAL